ncbi:MAG: hypothetical protein K2L62_04755 [Muribaculaceae bacterium]|nr:hypothetical protein [Muribaculaceae bacterium]
MADNFLEKQMEDFRAGRLGKPAVRRRISSGQASPLGQARILVVCRSLEFAQASLEVLCPAAAKVAAVIPASASASALTQRLGARYYPTPDGKESDIMDVMRDILHNWHTLDLIVTDNAVPEYDFNLPVIKAEVNSITEAYAPALGSMALYALSGAPAPASLLAPGITITLTNQAPQK